MTLPRISLATLQAAYPGVDFNQLRQTALLSPEERERELAERVGAGKAVAAGDGAHPFLPAEEMEKDAEALVQPQRAGRLRTPLELLAVRRGDVPKGMPVGPWRTDTEALAELNRYAADHRTNGGAHGLVWTNGLNRGNTRRGDQHRLGCDQHKKQNCGWSVTVEETTAGWMICAFTEHVAEEGKPPVNDHGHSHALGTTLGERLAHATQREIPEELHADARLMYKSGSSVKDVENFLRAKVAEKGDTAAFTYQDVYRLVGASTSERAWDASDFVEELERRSVEDGLGYKIHLSAEGVMDRAFFVMKNGLEIIAGCAEGAALVFDTTVRPAIEALRTPLPPSLRPRRCTAAISARLHRQTHVMSVLSPLKRPSTSATLTPAAARDQLPQV